MMNQENSNSNESTTSQAKDISSPDLSFADYQTLRRGGKITGGDESSATKPNEAKSKSPSPESDPEESESNEEGDESEKLASDEEADSKDSDGKKAGKKGGFQRRIDKLNARVSERERELEYWKAQASKGAGDEKVKETKTATPAEGKPNPDDFDTHADYIEALTDWKTEAKFSARELKAEQAKIQDAQNAVMQKHSDRVKAFSESHRDFSELLENVDEIAVSPAVQELIISSDHGPALMYELAKNPAEFERINSLTPLQAAKELGRLETKLSSKDSSGNRVEAKRTTSAPKPMSPLGTGKGAVAKSISDPNLSFSDYERMRHEQMKRR